MSYGALVEDYARVTVDDLRRLLGGRKKLKAADAVTLHLAAADVPVALTRTKANLGEGGQVVFMCCPACGRRISVLRLLPDGRGAVCGLCVRRAGARYASQVGV